MIKSKEELDKYLARSLFCVLSYPDGEKIKTRFMLFGHNQAGVFYLYQQRDSEDFTGLSGSPVAAGLMIYREEENLDDIVNVSIQGTASLVEDINSEEATEALKIIGEKSPVIQNLADMEERAGLTIVRVNAEVIDAIDWSSLNDGLSPLTLKKQG